MLNRRKAVSRMTSLFPPRRRFDSIEHVVHEKLPFSICKTFHSQSTVFKGNVYDRIETRRIFAEFEERRDESYLETRCTLEEILCDQDQEDAAGQENDEDHQNVVGLVRLNCRQNLYRGGLMQVVQLVSIPNSVEELCEKCFYACVSLLRATFGESSSLMLIGKKAFYRSGVVEIHIPDGVEELGEKC